MNINAVKIAAKEGLNKLAAHSPSILTGLSVAASVTAVILTARGTIKAAKIVEEKELDDKIDIVKNCWPCYIPAAISLTTSIACAIGSNSVNAKRNAALAGAYALAADGLKQYKEKAKELLGEKKTADIRDKIAEDQFKDASNKMIVITGKGDILMKEMTSGQYFRSTHDAVNAAINQANRDMVTDGCVNLNDVYYYLGIGQTALGSKMYWKIDDGFLDVSYGCAVSEGGEPCLTVEFDKLPVYRYDEY